MKGPEIRWRMRGHNAAQPQTKMLDCLVNGVWFASIKQETNSGLDTMSITFNPRMTLLGKDFFPVATLRMGIDMVEERINGR